MDGGASVAVINPTRIIGRWREGFALDVHTISSIHVGDDEFGHPVFETRRSELGELLYQLKYRSDVSGVAEIARAVADFVRKWDVRPEAIVPVPPTRGDRPHQPVWLVAAALGGLLGAPVCEKAVTKKKDTPQLKDVFDYNERLSLLAGAFGADPRDIRGRRVLLLDDLYRSGATMNAVASVLYDDGGAVDVYALALTRTRRKS
jgi:predicted amidophosphoribosyltransferase